MSREKTNYTGVYERKSAHRKHKGKPDICYEITYKRNGKQIREKVGWSSEGYNAKLASIVRAERIRNIRHGEELPQDKSTIPFFRDAANKYLEWAKTNKTRQGYNQNNIYKNHLANVFDGKRLDEINSFQLEQLKSSLFKKGLAPASVKHCLVVFREIFNKAIKWGSLTLPNPIRDVKLPNPQNNRLRFYTREEADQLMAALKKYKHLHDISLLSLRTGLRFKEITGIKGQDLDFNNDIINVIDSKNGQTDHVFMTPDIREILKGYNTPTHEYIFKNSKGERIKEVSDTFERTIKKLGFNEGITDRRQLLTFHSLRHTFASWLAQNGEDLKSIQELMRHKTISMTIKYAHLIPDKKRQAVNNIIKQK